jgi:hypothetical protein
VTRLLHPCRCLLLQPLFVPQEAPSLECQAVQLVAEILMTSAPNLPGTGAEGPSQDSHETQLPFRPEQLAAAEAPLTALQRLYQQETQLAVQPLRHPRLLQLLLSGAPLVCSPVMGWVLVGVGLMSAWVHHRCSNV